MALAAASVSKVQYVLEIARKDGRFMNDLSRDPFRTLQESGIDLSPGEIMAVIDVVKGTAHSLLGPRLQPLRSTWENVVADASFRAGPTTEPPGTGPTAP